jgi:hypothetical protein
VTSDDAFAQLATLTGLSMDEWRDLISLPAPAQALCVEAYRDQAWVRHPETLAYVLDVLSVVGTIAGVAGGLAGATSAIAALRAL